MWLSEARADNSYPFDGPKSRAWTWRNVLCQPIETNIFNGLVPQPKCQKCAKSSSESVQQFHESSQPLLDELAVAERLRQRDIMRGDEPKAGVLDPANP